MDWHDIVYAVGGFVLILPVIIMLVKGTPVPLSSSVICSVWLGIFSVTFFDLGLYLASVSNAVACVTWLLLVPRGLAKAPSSLFFHNLMLMPKDLRPDRGAILFNRTANRVAIITTAPEDRVVGAVVLGSLAGPSWATGDDVESIGYAWDSALAKYAPQPRPRRIKAQEGSANG